MNPIKLRAWDDAAKKMSYGEPEQFDDMLGFRFHHFETEKPVYMQFIGRQDKAGKDIYVGDIVKTSWQHDGVTCYDYEVIGKIEFSEECLRYVIVADKGSQIIFYPICSFEREELHEDEIEILGNIHENPELLEEKSC